MLALPMRRTWLHSRSWAPWDDVRIKFYTNRRTRSRYSIGLLTELRWQMFELLRAAGEPLDLA